MLMSSASMRPHHTLPRTQLSRLARVHNTCSFHSISAPAGHFRSIHPDSRFAKTTLGVLSLRTVVSGGCFQTFHLVLVQGEIGTMETKPAQNIQDTFLNTARKDKSPITIYLMSGVKLSGRIRSFDKYSVVLETNNQEQLIFKHAISTVVMAKSSYHTENRTHQPAAAEGEVSTTKSEG